MSLLSTTLSTNTVVSIPSQDGILTLTIAPIELPEQASLQRFTTKNDSEGLYKQLCRILPNKIKKMVLCKNDGTEVVEDTAPTEAEFLDMLKRDFPTFDYIAANFLDGEQKKVLVEMNQRS
jgi:hypothetical protein